MIHATRRSVLIGLLGLTAGCVRSGARDDSARGGPTTPINSDANEITDVSFHHPYPEMQRFPDTEPPRVTFDAERTRVVVTGLMHHGSCEELELGRGVYEQSSDTLRVAVSRRAEDRTKVRACTDVERATEYRVKIAFSNHLPRRVIASEERREHADDMPPQRTVARRERSAD